MKDPGAEIAVALIKFAMRRRITRADAIVGCMTAATLTMHQMPEAEHLEAMEASIELLRADYLRRVAPGGSG